ncbi:MAG: PA14 domain-containing protein, partial [bacterium]
MKKLILALVFGVMGMGHSDWYPLGDGRFSPEGERLCLKSRGGFFLLERNLEREEYLLKTKVKIEEGNRTFIFLSNGGYRISLGEKLLIEKLREDSLRGYRGSFTTLEEIPISILDSNWHKIKIIKHQRGIVISLDDYRVSLEDTRWGGQFIALGVDNGTKAIFDNIEIVYKAKKKGIGILHSPEGKDRLTHEFITYRATGNYPISETYWESYYRNMVIEGSGGESQIEGYPGEDGEDLDIIEGEFYTTSHFYNPETGLGITIPLYGRRDSSLKKAKELWNMAIEDYRKGRKYDAYYTLGRIAHLLEDTTSPAHSHLIVHNIPLYEKDYFENWCPTQKASEAYSTNTISSHDSLDEFFKETAYLSFGKATLDINGISASYVNDMINMVYEASNSGNGRYKTYKMDSEKGTSAQEYLKRWIPKIILKPEGGFSANYYNNKDLTGTPVLTRNDKEIDFEWGDSSPDDSSVPKDIFSARWTASINIPHNGKYTFYTKTDDGVRLWIDKNKNGIWEDSECIIDEWHDKGWGTGEYRGNIELSSGSYNLKMEYYENEGKAYARLYWESDVDNIRVEKLAKYLFPATIMKVSGLIKHFDNNKPGLDSNNLDYIIDKSGKFFNTKNIDKGPITYVLTLKNLGDPVENVKVNITIKYQIDNDYPEGTVTQESFEQSFSCPGEEKEISIQFDLSDVSPTPYYLYAYGEIEYLGKVRKTFRHMDWVNATPIIVEADPPSIEVDDSNYETAIPLIITVESSETGMPPLKDALVMLSGYISASTKTDENGRATFNILLDKQQGNINANIYCSDVEGNYKDYFNFIIPIIDKRPPLIIEGPNPTQIGANFAEISWKTDELSINNEVEYGLTTNYGRMARGFSGTTSHSVDLENLLPENTYNYRVKSTDYAGNTRQGENLTFTTIKGTGTPPYVRVISPNGGEVLKGEQDIVFITADDEPLTITVELWKGEDTPCLYIITMEGIGPGTITTTIKFDTQRAKNGNNYRINVNANDGIYMMSDTSDGVFTIDNTPLSTQLLSAYPNPFDSGVWIPFTLSSDGNVKIKIYKAYFPYPLRKTLNLGYKKADSYIAPGKAAFWDGRDNDGNQVSGLHGYYLYVNDSEIGSKLFTRQSGALSATFVSPSSAEVVTGIKEIRWSGQGLSGNISLEYSYNEGNTWQSIATVEASSGVYRWDTKNVLNGTRYVVRLGDKGYSYVFTINNKPSTPSIKILSPKTRDIWKGRNKIRWEASDPSGMPLKINIYISGDDGKTWATIAEGKENEGVYELDADQMLDGIYKIRVGANNGITLREACSERFKIVKDISKYWGKERKLSSYVDNLKLAIERDKIYLLWYDIYNNNLYYQKNIDKGLGWIDPISIGKVYSPGSYSSPNAMDIAVKNGEIHIVWCSYQKEIGKNVIKYRRSLDEGINWDSEVILVEGKINDWGRELEHPRITVDKNNNVHLVWQDRRERGELRKMSNIYYRCGVNKGSIWENEQKLTFSSEDKRHWAPLIVSNEEGIHISWLADDYPYYPLYVYYRKSSDFGITWNEPILLGERDIDRSISTKANKTGGDCDESTLEPWLGSNHFISTNKKEIYVGWLSPGILRPIVYRKSMDGENWGTSTKILLGPNEYMTNVRMLFINNTIHLIWERDELETKITYICHKRSNDGISWEEEKVGIKDWLSKWYLNYILSADYDDENIYIFWNESDGLYHKSRPIDPTPPSIPLVTDSGRFTSVTTQLHIQCASVDPETGIAEYQYCMGTSYGKNDVLDWKSSGTITEIVVGGLNLTQGGTYYIGVKARNNGGLWSDIGYSDGITVDTTPPSTPIVADRGTYTSLTQLSADWSSSDLESGVEYYYAIGTSEGGTDTLDFRDAGKAVGGGYVGLSLTNDRTYYFTVRAINGAGLCSIGYSDGITIDLTPPTITNPKAIPGTASPGSNVKFTALITDSLSGIGSVTIDLSPIGGLSNQPMSGSGNGTYSYTYTIPNSVSMGKKNLVITAYDMAKNSVSATITLTIESPPSSPTNLQITEIRTNSYWWWWYWWWWRWWRSMTSMTLHWDQNPESGIAYYNIYRNGVKIGRTWGNYSWYWVWYLPYGDYRYTVTVVSREGYESEQSKEIRIIRERKNWWYSNEVFSIWGNNNSIDLRLKRGGGRWYDRYTFYLYPKDKPITNYTKEPIGYNRNSWGYGIIDSTNQRLIIRAYLFGYWWRPAYFNYRYTAISGKTSLNPLKIEE